MKRERVFLYVEGDPINHVDPSGLCKVDDPNVAQCRSDADELVSSGFYPLWDVNPLDSLPKDQCLQVLEILGIGSNEMLGWSAVEMRSLLNGVKILETANQQIEGFKTIRTGISLVKVVSLANTVSATPQTNPTPTPTPTPTPPSATPVPPKEPLKVAGKTTYDGRIIQLSEDVWSDLNEQQRSWILIHEFGHILIRDLGFGDAAQADLAKNVTSEFGGLYPTQYSFGRPIEYLIEAIAGTIWNYGYRAVSGYDASAENRTTLNTYPEYFSNTQVFQTDVNKDNILENRYVVNVRLITNANGGSLANSANESNTLENWIINKILGR